MSFLRPIWRRVNTKAIAYRRASLIGKENQRTVLAWRYYSSGVTETDEDFDARWVAYFNRPDLDTWELKKGLNELYGHDLVPEPQIVVAMLNAARRLNDIAMAIRILEAVKEKAAGNNEIYSYVIEAVKPTLEEMGVATPEELGLA